MFSDRIHKDPNQHLTVTNTLTLPAGGTGVTDKQSAQDVLDIIDESARLTALGVAIMPEDEQLAGWAEGGAGLKVTVRGPKQVDANTTTVFTISNFDINTAYHISCETAQVWRDMALVYLKTDARIGPCTVVINNSQFTVDVVRVLISKPAPMNLQDRQINVGSSFVLRLTPYSSQTNTTFHKGTDWQLSKDPSFAEVVSEVKQSTESLLSWPVKDLEPDTTYYVRSRYIDNAGNTSDWSDTTMFETRESFAPITPSIQLPVINSSRIGSSVVVESSDFETTEVDTSHVSSDWELSASSVFNGLITESSKDKTNLTNWQVTGLSEDTAYYVRVRYVDDKGRVSNWSQEHSFKTRDSFGANVPVIESPSDAVTQQNSHMDVTSSMFDHDEIGLTHVSSDWELSEDATFAYPQIKSYSDGQSLRNWRADKLQPNKQYYVRVRYRDDKNGVSEWSKPVSFKTKSSFVPRKPNVVFPVHNSRDATHSMNFRSDIFVSGDLESVHHSSDWELATNSSFTNVVKAAMATMNNKTQWSVNRLDSAALYFLRVRYRSIKSGVMYESDWSDSVSFSVKDIMPGQPGMMTPVNGLEVDFQGELRFSASAFVEGMPGETHASSDWQMSLSDDFSTLFKTANASAAYKTNWAVTGLDAGQTYYVRVKYRANTGRQSAWSTVTSIKTKDHPQAVVPFITSPNDGTLNAAVESVRFTCSAFDVVLDGDSHESTDWELAAEPNFKSALESSYASTSNKTSWLIYSLAFDTEFYVRVRHRGSMSGDTRWSSPTKFKTRSAPVVKAPGTPEIVFPVDSSSKNPLAPTIRASSFYSENQGDVHLNSDWELATEPTFDVIEKSIYTSVGYKTTWSLADLFANTIYYVRVRYRGSVGGQSEWSQVQTFKTGLKVVSGGVASGDGTDLDTDAEDGLKSDPERPSIIYPSDRDTDNIPTTVTIKSSVFRSRSKDEHFASRWFLRDEQGTTLIKESGQTKEFRTAWVLKDLEEGTGYQVNVIYEGQEKGDSIASKPATFVTRMNTTIATPTIVHPTSLGKVTDLVVEGSVFTTSKDGQIHASSDWEVYNTSNTLIFNKYDDTENKITLPLSTLFAGLVKDAKYSVRVRYKGPGGMAERSLWSKKVEFKTTDQDVTLPPEILFPLEGDELDSTPYVDILVSSFGTTQRSLTYVGMEIEISSDPNFVPASTVTYTRIRDSYLDGVGSKLLHLKPPRSYGQLWVRSKFFASDGNEPNWSSPVSFTLKQGSRPLLEKAKIGANVDILTSDYFAYSVALNKTGEFVVVGDPAMQGINPQSPYGDGDPFPRGGAYVFRRVENTWPGLGTQNFGSRTLSGAGFAAGTSYFQIGHTMLTWWGEGKCGLSVAAGDLMLAVGERQIPDQYHIELGGTLVWPDTKASVWIYAKDRTVYTNGVATTGVPDTPFIISAGGSLYFGNPKAQTNDEAYKSSLVHKKWRNMFEQARSSGQSLVKSYYDYGGTQGTPVLAMSSNDKVIAVSLPALNAVSVRSKYLEKGHTSELEEWLKNDAVANKATDKNYPEFRHSAAFVKDDAFVKYTADTKYDESALGEMLGDNIAEIDNTDVYPTIFGTDPKGTFFGSSLALNEDGTVLYVGCIGKPGSDNPKDDGTGTTGIGFVIKYRFTGSKWQRVGIVSGPGYGFSVACDASGDVFVTGGFKQTTLQYTSDTVAGAQMFPQRPQAKITTSVTSMTGTMVYGRMDAVLKEVVYYGEPDSDRVYFNGVGGSSSSALGNDRRTGRPTAREATTAFPMVRGWDFRYFRSLGTYGNRGWDVCFGKKVAMTGDGVPVTVGRDYIQFSDAHTQYTGIYPIRAMSVSFDGKHLAIAQGSFREDSGVIMYGV